MQSNDTEELNVTYMRFSFYPLDGLGALNGHFGTEQPGHLVIIVNLQLGLMAVMMVCINGKRVNCVFGNPQ